MPGSSFGSPVERVARDVLFERLFGREGFWFGYLDRLSSLRAEA